MCTQQSLHKTAALRRNVAHIYVLFLLHLHWRGLLTNNSYVLILFASCWPIGALRISLDKHRMECLL